MRAFDKAVSVQKKAFTGQLKCMYFLNKQEIAHTTKFLPLVELGKSLGATYLGDVNVGRNAKYTSERFMQEIVLSLGETIRQEIMDEVKSSPVFSLLIDGTTDVAVTKQPIIFARYIYQKKPKVASVDIVELVGGKAQAISDAVLQFC